MILLVLKFPSNFVFTGVIPIVYASASACVASEYQARWTSDKVFCYIAGVKCKL